MGDTKKNKKIITKDKSNKTYDTIILIIILIIFINILYLFSNKTFLRKKYTNNNFELDIPMFTFFVSDKNNEITFKSLRNEYYIDNFFDEYLSNLNDYDYYVCKNGKSIYYNENTKLAINKINIEKHLFVKTIKINYQIKSLERLCDN